MDSVAANYPRVLPPLLVTREYSTYVLTPEYSLYTDLITRAYRSPLQALYCLLSTSQLVSLCFKFQVNLKATL